MTVVEYVSYYLHCAVGEVVNPFKDVSIIILFCDTLALYNINNTKFIKHCDAVRRLQTTVSVVQSLNVLLLVPVFHKPNAFQLLNYMLSLK